MTPQERLQMAKVKLVEVYDDSYIRLRTKYPKAFAIRPQGRGYKAVVKVRVVDETNARRRD